MIINIVAWIPNRQLILKDFISYNIKFNYKNCKKVDQVIKHKLKLESQSNCAIATNEMESNCQNIKTYFRTKYSKKKLKTKNRYSR